MLQANEIKKQLEYAKSELALLSGLCETLPTTSEMAEANENDIEANNAESFLLALFNISIDTLIDIRNVLNENPNQTLQAIENVIPKLQAHYDNVGNDSNTDIMRTIGELKHISEQQ